MNNIMQIYIKSQNGGVGGSILTVNSLTLKNGFFDKTKLKEID